MSRIGASISGFERLLLNQLNRVNSAAALNSLRLATNKRINSPGEDPAAFIQISSLENRLSIVEKTITQVSAASTVASKAQLTLDQIRTQLDTIRTALLTDEDQSLDAATRALKQSEIDTALDQVNTLAKTDVNGRRILDGSADFRTSGLNSAQIRDLTVFSVGGLPTFSGVVSTAATQATLTYTGSGGQTTAAATYTLTGALGSTTITLTNAEALTDVRDRINLDSHKTGITASVSGDDLTFTTVRFGTKATAAVKVTSGTFAVTGGNGDGTAQGTNVVVEINGNTISGNTAAVDGNRVTFNENGLHFTVEFAAGFIGNTDTVTISNDTTLKFALTTDPGLITTVGLRGFQTAQLGGLSGTLDQLKSGGSLAGLATNTSQAIRVVDEALSQLSLIEGRVDGFADGAITSSTNLLNSFKTTLTDSLDDINGISTTEQELLLAKNQVLADNIVSSLAILQQQRGSIVIVLKQIAGLI